MYENIRFPGWDVVRKIGEGSFGGVYEIHRTLPDGRVEKAALKKLTVPKDNSEIRELYSQSFSKENITAHYKDQMQGLLPVFGVEGGVTDDHGLLGGGTGCLLFAAGCQQREGQTEAQDQSNSFFHQDTFFHSTLSIRRLV